MHELGPSHLPAQIAFLLRGGSYIGDAVTLLIGELLGASEQALQPRDCRDVPRACVLMGPAEVQRPVAHLDGSTCLRIHMTVLPSKLVAVPGRRLGIEDTA